MVITGFILDNAAGIWDIEEIVSKCERKVRSASEALFHRLLADEAALITDQVALGIIARDPDISILDAAAFRLSEKIRLATEGMAETPYNFRIILSFLADDEHNKKNLYVSIGCENEELIKAAGKALSKYGSWYNLSEAEARDKKNAKTIKWAALHQKYEKMQPLSVNITFIPPVNPDLLSFPDKKVRSIVQARHFAINHFVGQLLGGRSMRPDEMAPIMDMAFNLLESDEGKELIKEQAAGIIKRIPDLDKDSDYLRFSFNDLMVKGSDAKEDIEEDDIEKE